MELTELNVGEDSDEYKVKIICNSAVYARESTGHLLGLYYLVFQKSYPKEENTQEFVLAVQYLKKFISLFYKDYPNKLTAILKAIDTAPQIARPTIKPAVKPTVRPIALKQK